MIKEFFLLVYPLCLDMTSEVLADNEDLLHQLSAELGLGALLQDPGPAQVSDIGALLQDPGPPLVSKAGQSYFVH